MRQQIVDTQILAIGSTSLYDACDDLLNTSKESGAYSSWLPQRIDSRITSTIFHLDDHQQRPVPWVEFERKRGIKDITIDSGPGSSIKSAGMQKTWVTTFRNTNGASGLSKTSQSVT